MQFFNKCKIYFKKIFFLGGGVLTLLSVPNKKGQNPQHWYFCPDISTKKRKFWNGLPVSQVELCSTLEDAVASGVANLASGQLVSMVRMRLKQCCIWIRILNFDPMKFGSGFMPFHIETLSVLKKCEQTFFQVFFQKQNKKWLTH